MTFRGWSGEVWVAPEIKGYRVLQPLQGKDYSKEKNGRRVVVNSNVWLAKNPRGRKVVLKQVMNIADLVTLIQERNVINTINERLQSNGINEGYVVGKADFVEGKEGHYLEIPYIEETARVLCGKGSTSDVLKFGVSMTNSAFRVHAADFYHNDIKPENWRETLSSSGTSRATLIDFECATNRVPGANIGVHGTIGYASPMQMRGFVDKRGNVYGIAATVGELLCGESPVMDAIQLQDGGDLRLAHILETTPPKIEKLIPKHFDLPDVAREAIDRAFNPDPLARPSLKELRDAFATGAFELENLEERTHYASSVLR